MMTVERLCEERQFQKIALAQAMCNATQPLVRAWERDPMYALHAPNQQALYWNNLKFHWTASCDLGAWAALAYGDLAMETVLVRGFVGAARPLRDIWATRTAQGLAETPPFPELAHEPGLTALAAEYGRIASSGELDVETMWRACALKLFMAGAQYLLAVADAQTDGDVFVDTKFTAAWLSDDMCDAVRALVTFE